MIKPTEKFYPRFLIKFTLNGKPINSLSTKKSLRILYRIRVSESKFKWDKAFLKFRYDNNFDNEGYYQNPKDLTSAYRCFMEIVPEFTNENLIKKVKPIVMKTNL